MTKKRVQYEDTESDLSIFLITSYYTDPISRQVLFREAHRLEMLFNIISLGGEMDSNGSFSEIAIAVRNKKLTDEEAEERCRKYDEMIENEGIEATELDIEVQPRKICKPHRYSSEKLNSVKDFMHDFNWNVCYQSWVLSGQDKSHRPRVRKRYTSLMIDLNTLPSHFGEQTRERIKAKLKLLGLQRDVPLSGSSLYNGPGILGKKQFVESVTANAGISLARRKQIKQVKLFSEQEFSHLTELPELNFREICLGVVDSPLFLELKDMLLNCIDGDPRPYCSLGKTLLFGGPLGVLWLCDGTLRWIKKKRLLTDETLTHLLEDCRRRANNNISPPPPFQSPPT